MESLIIQINSLVLSVLQLQLNVDRMIEANNNIIIICYLYQQNNKYKSIIYDNIGDTNRANNNNIDKIFDIDIRFDTRELDEANNILDTRFNIREFKIRLITY